MAGNWLAGIVACMLVLIVQHQAQAQSTIPFIGCPGSGISTPTEPPTGKPLKVNLPSNVTKNLSFYVGEATGILAPRGWRCAGFDYNDGRILLVYPNNAAINGPMIVDVYMGADGEQGARVTLAYICRYFSKLHYNNSQQNVCASGSSAESQGGGFQGFHHLLLVPLPKYTHDRLSYKNAYIMQYTTPAGTIGLGTSAVRDMVLYDKIIISGYTYVRPKVSSLNSIGFVAVGKMKKGQNLFDGLEIFSARLPESQASELSAILDFQEGCFLEGVESVCAASGVYPGNTD